MSAPDNREIEIKLPLPDAATGRGLLARAGFRETRARVFEANSVFDTPGQDLRAAGKLLRVREVDGSGLLTYKGPPTPGRHKDREELEVQCAPSAVAAILSRLGFMTVFRYEKYRTEYTDGAGAATLDETPIGCFLELEGAPEWIDRTAGALGFTERDYITASYGRLWQERRAGLPPGDMTFGPAERPGV